jgi:hypothetical protein
LLVNEARWVEAALAGLEADRLDPVLSIGSGTPYAREVLQPWVDRHVYAPLRRRGIRVLHHEYTAGPGIDHAGDLLDPEVSRALVATQARSLLCCNVFEHLERRRPVANMLAAALPAGGYAIVTVPRRFPFHPDPIDTMFRPTVSELGAELPGFRVIRGEEVKCETLIGYLRSSGSIGRSIRNGLSSLRRRSSAAERRGDRAPRGQSAGWAASPFPYLLTRTAVTCALLERLE